MIAIFDVDYKEDKANAACIIALNWDSKEPVNVYKKNVYGIAEYEPGFFYKRELPCILSLIEDLRENLDYLVVDGYVWLGENPGLGYHLYKATKERAPVIGVAKTTFHNNFNAMEVIRGKSKKPLFVTSVGIDLTESGKFISNMYGENRLPSLIKLADTSCRKW